MIVFVGREMTGGSGHEHVTALYWIDTPSTVENRSVIEEITRWLDISTNHAFVEDRARPGHYVEAYVVKPANGRWYVRTYADGRWTDNILALPLRRQAA